jgi:hypothetical protein
MLNPDQLKVGSPYFMISYYDEARVVPEIETLIYVGKNLLKISNEKDIWYFQNPVTYLSKGAFHLLPTDDYDVYSLGIEYVETLCEVSTLTKYLLDPFCDY